MKLVIDETVINTKHIVEVSTISGISLGGQISIKLDNGTLVRSSLSTDIELKIAEMFILYGYKLGRDTLFFGKRDMLTFMKALIKYASNSGTGYSEYRELYKTFGPALEGLNRENPCTYEDYCDCIDLAVRSVMKKYDNIKWHEAFYMAFNLGKCESLYYETV